MNYYLLDMSGYVISRHKSSEAATAAQLNEWRKNKTKGMSVEKSVVSIKRGNYFWGVS